MRGGEFPDEDSGPICKACWSKFDGCDCELNALKARVAALEAELELARGVTRSDDARLLAAEERIWPGMTHGCDAAEWMADEIIGLRERCAKQTANAARAERVVAWLLRECRERPYIWQRGPDNPDLFAELTKQGYLVLAKGDESPHFCTWRHGGLDIAPEFARLMEEETGE